MMIILKKTKGEEESLGKGNYGIKTYVNLT